MKTSAKLRTMVEQLDVFLADEDGCYCGGLIAEARAKLQEAFESNLHEEQQEARDAADDRRTRRAENGHPQ